MRSRGWSGWPDGNVRGRTIRTRGPYRLRWSHLPVPVSLADLLRLPPGGIGVVVSGSVGLASERLAKNLDCPRNASRPWGNGWHSFARL